MLAGTYFYYCTETSTKTKQVFRYRYLRDHNSKDEAIGKSHHPVFVMISPNAIGFYIEPISARNIPANEVVDDSSSYHLLQLFSIPLYPKDSKLDRLTEAIINLCNENGIDRKNNRLSTNKTLFNNNYIIHNDKYIEKNGLLKYWVLFQHLLYDLSFSDVFRNASAYEEAIIRLRENYFVNCIIAKCEYKFWESQYKKNSQSKYIQNRLWEADKTWVSLILDERNNQILEISHKWFDGAEEELRILLKIDFGLCAFFNIEKFFHENDRKFLFAALLKQDFNFRMREIKIQRDGIYHFFLQRFSTWSLEKFIFMYNKTKYASFVILVLSLSLLAASSYIYQNCNFSIFVVFLLTLIGGAQGALKPFLFFLSNSILNTYNIYNKKNYTYRLWRILCQYKIKRVSQKLGRIEKKEDNLTNASTKSQKKFDRRKEKKKNLIKSLSDDIKNWDKIYMRENIFYHINFYNHAVGYPKMSLAIIAIWLGYIPVCEEAWQINVLLDNFIFAIYYSFLLIIIFSFIFYFVNDVHFGDRSLLGIGKSTALFIKGMSVSMTFGLFAMEASRENIFDSPADFFPKEIGISRIDTLSKTIDSIEFELLAHSNVDKVQILCKHLPVIKKYLPIKSQNEIKPTLFNNLIAVKNSLIIGLTNNHMKGRDFWKVPSITNFNLFNHNFFIFPKLLLTYSAFAFFIGLFAQVAFQGSNYKENL